MGSGAILGKGAGMTGKIHWYVRRYAHRYIWMDYKRVNCMKRRVVLSIITMLELLIFLCSCKALGRYESVEYEGKKYELINMNWELENDTNEPIRVRVGDAKVLDAYKYNDVPFILIEDYLNDVWYCNMDELPKNTVNDVEKVVINYYDTTVNPVVIRGNNIEVFLEVIERYDQNVEHKSISDCIGTVDVHYHNFVASLFIGQLIVTNDGDMGLYMMDKDEGMDGEIDQYVILPESLFS